MDKITVATLAPSSIYLKTAQKIKMGEVDRMTIEIADPKTVVLMAYNTQFLAVKMGKTDISRDCKLALDIFDSYGSFPIELNCFNILKRTENMN